MDQPREQQEQSSRPAQRDMMFCHECMDEWYRDQHGLTCPECGSDFTEIIEQDNDPRDFTHDEHPGDDDDDSMHSGDDGPSHPHPHDNPWANDDPEEGDISNVHFSRVGPSQYNVQATFTRSIPPGGMTGGAFGPSSIGGFMSMLNGLAGHPGLAQHQQQNQLQMIHRNPDQNSQGNEEGQQNNTPQNTNPQLPIRTSRFTYHGGIRLLPRDANNPEPRVDPVDEINNILAGFLTSIGPVAFPNQMRHDHNHDHDHDHEHGDGTEQEIPPILQFFTSLGLIPGGQLGDAVYSQEALDRIVSQLMEQTAGSNAPGPASQNDIDHLPRRNVDEEMLGAEGRAECSICMDEVNLGEEVTELPCKHWFHHQCVAAWLGEHDTCPHCRKGITKQNEAGAGTSSGEQTAPRAEPSNSMPGAFVSGEGTVTNPFVVQGDLGTTHPQNNQHNSGNQESSTQDNNGHGLGERLRRGLFGP